jgi:hypothetical protein
MVALTRANDLRASSLCRRLSIKPKRARCRRVRGVLGERHAQREPLMLTIFGEKGVWADGVYLQARMEPQAECMLVLMGATAEGKKELIGFQTGMRESGLGVVSQ